MDNYIFKFIKEYNDVGVKIEHSEDMCFYSNESPGKIKEYYDEWKLTQSYIWDDYINIHYRYPKYKKYTIMFYRYIKNIYKDLKNKNTILFNKGGN